MGCPMRRCRMEQARYSGPLNRLPNMKRGIPLPWKPAYRPSPKPLTNFATSALNIQKLRTNITVNYSHIQITHHCFFSILAHESRNGTVLLKIIRFSVDKGSTQKYPCLSN